MTCPACGSKHTRVKASRGPQAARTHIPVQVLEDINEDLGILTEHWYARSRTCGDCSHAWWTVEAAVGTIAKLPYHNT